MSEYFPESKPSEEKIKAELNWSNYNAAGNDTSPFAKRMI